MLHAVLPTTRGRFVRAVTAALASAIAGTALALPMQAESPGERLPRADERHPPSSLQPYELSPTAALVPTFERTELTPFEWTDTVDHAEAQQGQTAAPAVPGQLSSVDVLRPFVSRVPPHERVAVANLDSSASHMTYASDWTAPGSGLPAAGGGLGLDAAMAELLLSSIEPLINLDGSLSFSLFGFGEFNAALSAKRDRLVLREAETGARITLRAPTSEPAEPPPAQTWSGGQVASSSDERAIRAWLVRLERAEAITITLLTSPWLWLCVGMVLVARLALRLAIARSERRRRRRQSRRTRQRSRRGVGAGELATSAAGRTSLGR